MSDTKPLLPTHTQNQSQFAPPQHRLSQPRISFPSSSPSKPSNRDGGEAGDQHIEPWMAQREREGSKPGIPKLTRECFFAELKCYGEKIVLVLFLNGIAIGLGLWWYFSKVHKR